ncbi:MAG: relaxation protein [Pseudomonadota bacterium]|nr:relaxation protein [Pseudomonadota bacterium]
MQKEDLNVLIDKTATLMAQYERRGANIDKRLEESSIMLQGLSQQLPGVVRTASLDLLQTLPRDTVASIRQGLDLSLEGYRQSLGRAGSEVLQVSHALAAQISDLQRLHRQLIWKTMVAVGLALALLLAGGAWLSMYYTNVIRNNQLSAQLLEAYNRADVRLCGNGSLCANVNSKGARYGADRQYLLVKQR